MMFSVPGTTNIQDFLQPPEFSPVKWLEGTIKDDSPPKYLMPTQRRRGLLDNANWSTLVVSIGGLGGGRLPRSIYNLV